MTAATVFNDRVKETTTTTGTGTITLAGAVSQFLAFQTVYAVGDAVHYAIVGQSGTEWEVGIGTLATTTTLSRDQVLASSNSNAAVNFSAGTKDVFNTASGYWTTRSSPRGRVLAKATGQDWA